MPEFYRMYAKQDLHLWSPYVAFRIVPPKETEYGSYTKSKIMMSVGRTIKSKIDREQVDQLPERTKENLLGKFRNETSLRPELSVKDRVINSVVKSYFKIDKKARRILGIRMHRTENQQWEIYQFCKFEKVDEMLPFVWGYGRSIGVMAKINNLTEEEVNKLIIEMRTNMATSIKQGYSMAKENNWR